MGITRISRPQYAITTTKYGSTSRWVCAVAEADEVLGKGSNVPANSQLKKWGLSEHYFIETSTQ